LLWLPVASFGAPSRDPHRPTVAPLLRAANPKARAAYPHPTPTFASIHVFSIGSYSAPDFRAPLPRTVRIIVTMPEDPRRAEAEKAIDSLRSEADNLLQRSRELAEQALRLKQRADDLAQLLKQHDARD